MVDIVCRLKDYSMLYVDVEPGLAAEISDYFSFFVPGYKFMPAYKNKVWDGKIKLFNRMTGELSAGLYVYLIKFAAERSYSLDTEESDYGLPVPDSQSVLQSLPDCVRHERRNIVIKEAHGLGLLRQQGRNDMYAERAVLFGDRVAR